MSQYNFDRTGANLSELVLNTSNVDPAHFGKLFTRAVDDSVYGLPLIIPNLPIAGGVHDVLFVATMNNSVYAFDTVDAPIKPLAPHPPRNAATILIECGLRPEECFRLRWESVQNSCIEIRSRGGAFPYRIG